MDSQYFAKTPFYHEVKEKILSLTSIHDRQVLEWGCSLGDCTVAVARKLSKSRIYAVESDPVLVEMIRGKYTPQDYRNVMFEVAALDELVDFVKVRHLQLDLVIFPFILHRLGDKQQKKGLFEQVASLPASPRLIVSDIFKPEDASENAMQYFWEGRAGEIYRNTFWNVLNVELANGNSFGEAKQLAQRAARADQDLELKMGKQITAKGISHLITETELEQIAAEVGFSHIFHEKSDACGNSIFVIQK